MNNMIQAIHQLAAEMADQINQNKSEDGYTIICTHRELRHMVSEAANTSTFDEDDAMFEFLDEMLYNHNLLLEVSQYDDVVLDEREEERWDTEL